VWSPSTNALHWFGGHTNYSIVGPISVPWVIGGYWNTAAVVDGFQVLTSSGNIASGTIKIYGRN
jgi:hypothetical protein